MQNDAIKRQRNIVADRLAIALNWIDEHIHGLEFDTEVTAHDCEWLKTELAEWRHKRALLTARTNNAHLDHIRKGVRYDMAKADIKKLIQVEK